MFDNINKLIRNLVLGGFVLLALWWTWYLRGKIDHGQDVLNAKDGEIERLTEELAGRSQDLERLEDDLADSVQRIGSLENDLVQRDLQISELNQAVDTLAESLRMTEASLQLMKVDVRLARLEVLSQEAHEGTPEQIVTRLRFVELSPAGETLGEPRELQIEGVVAYVETLVIKFEDGLIEGGDAMRGTSICLFRRIFGENQMPSQGVDLDAVGTRPLVYGSDGAEDSYHRDLWARFWDLANDAGAARELGVRAIHGEAPFIELRPGKSYTIELRASGGLSIQSEG